MITAKEYASRRERLMSHIGQDSIAIIPSASECLRNGDVYYPFRQYSDFYYLTGFNEPEACAVLIPGGEPGDFILFNQKKDPEQEVWTGPRIGQQGACEQFGADQAFTIDELTEELPKLLLGRKRIYYPIGRFPKYDKQLMTWFENIRAKVRAGVNAPVEFVDIEKIVHEMRLIKSEAEISILRHVAQLSAQAHIRAMKACEPEMYEYELEAELLHEFHRQGCRAQAYDAIVAGGANACILHYTDNQAKLAKEDLLLIDAGGEYQSYAADITRTFPVNGRFNSEQKSIYELVLRAQLAAIDVAKPGALWCDMQSIIVKIITEGLCELGLLSGDVEQLIESKAYRQFYMHNSGHWLGLDVHDAGQYKVNKDWRPLEAGMVLTIEPGIYIRPSNDVPEHWWHIGVRIEDDILITKNGCEVLSKDAPKILTEIEALMQQG